MTRAPAAPPAAPERTRTPPPPRDEAARLRTANRLAGALVLAALALLVGGLLEGNLVRGWLNPPYTLRVVLPESGVAGLAVGAEVQVLGITAGRVTRIVIEPDRPLLAEAQIDRGAAGFLRRDSRIFIRRQFGVAGAAFLEATRGSGPPIDWDYAVLTAETDRSASQNLDELIQELRGQIVPLIEDIGRTARNVAALTEGLASREGPLNSTLSALQDTAQRIQRGEGNVGRLLADESLIGEIETLISRANTMIAELQGTVAALSDEQQGIPAITRTAREAVGNVNQATRQAPTMARDLRVAAAALPGLLVQVQQASLELERLLASLRAHPLIGGGRSAEPRERLPPTQVRP
jgi:phospholipid/cholesterol/gamma-HCH transport system substrate-binding protein